MSTPTRPSARCPAKALHDDDLVDGRLTACESIDQGPNQPFLAELAGRDRPTHSEAGELSVDLDQRDTVSDPRVGGPDNAALTAEEDMGVMRVSSDDLAWMFAEDPKSTFPRGADDSVGRAFDDLLADWSRKGGQLTQQDVALLVTARRLDPVQHCELLTLLDDAGVEFPDITGPRPRRAAERGFEFHEDAVGQYLRAICRYSLIDSLREVELWSLISQGAAAQSELDKARGDALESHLQRGLRAQVTAGRHAHAELVCANLRLVVSIAKARHYESSGVEFIDRIQDGNLGLMRAADKFDGSKGFKFSTYATWWIKQSIDRGIGDRGRTIRLPVHVHERAQKIRVTISRLTLRLGRRPSLAEIADATGLEPGQVQAVLDITRPVVSLDSLLGDDGDLHLSDVLAVDEDRDGRSDPAEIVLHAMMRADLTRTLTALLPARSVRVLERRFGIGTGDRETLDQIGADFGVTRERIRQVQEAAFRTLRSLEYTARLHSYIVDDSTSDRLVGDPSKGDAR